MKEQQLEGDQERPEGDDKPWLDEGCTSRAQG